VLKIGLEVGKAYCFLHVRRAHLVHHGLGMGLLSS
jgi:hypothetical protein